MLILVVFVDCVLVVVLVYEMCCVVVLCFVMFGFECLLVVVDE